MEDSGEFRVDTASSAQDALDLFNILSYDVIVSGYLMFDMDGITFLKIVREEYGEFPFILFVGEGYDEVLIEAINYGADFYIQKGSSTQSSYTGTRDQTGRDEKPCREGTSGERGEVQNLYHECK